MHRRSDNARANQPPCTHERAPLPAHNEASLPTPLASSSSSEPVVPSSTPLCVVLPGPSCVPRCNIRCQLCSSHDIESSPKPPPEASAPTKRSRRPIDTMDPAIMTGLPPAAVNPTGAGESNLGVQLEECSPWWVFVWLRPHMWIVEIAWFDFCLWRVFRPGPRGIPQGSSLYRLWVYLLVASAGPVAIFMLQPVLGHFLARQERRRGFRAAQGGAPVEGAPGLEPEPAGDAAPEGHLAPVDERVMARHRLAERSKSRRYRRMRSRAWLLWRIGGMLGLDTAAITLLTASAALLGFGVVVFVLYPWVSTVFTVYLLYVSLRGDASGTVAYHAVGRSDTRDTVRLIGGYVER